MAGISTVFLIDENASKVAEFQITDEEDGWFLGKVIWQTMPSDMRRALDWYDEIVRDQMLSYLDDALARIQTFELKAVFPDGSAHKTYSLHITTNDEVSFRTSPVPER